MNVLIAQTQLLAAQQGLARIQAEQLIAHASLETALGGGLDDPANGPKETEALPGHGSRSAVALLTRNPDVTPVVPPTAAGR